MALSDFLVATEDAMECIDEGGFIEQHRVAYLIGVQAILGMSETSEGDKEIAAHRQSLLAGHLHTELLNRIDEAVIFHQLRKKDLGDVVEIQVGSKRTRLKARALDLERTPPTVIALGNEGYNPAFGTRPLKQVIQQQLEDEIAKRMLEGAFAEGYVVRMDFAGKTFVWKRVADEVGTTERTSDRAMSLETYRLLRETHASSDYHDEP